MTSLERFPQSTPPQSRIPQETPGFGDTIIFGMGPAAITLASMLEGQASSITGVTRNSRNGRRIRDELKEKDYEVATVGALNGSTQLDRFVLGYDGLVQAPTPQTIFLCTPNQGYAEAIQALSTHGMLEPGQRIVAISPRLGTGHALGEKLRNEGHNPNEFTVVSFSNYFGATKPVAGRRTRVYTRAVKDDTRAGMSREDRPTENAISGLFERIGAEVVFDGSTLAAEAHNSNTFVHGQLTLTHDVLNDIFRNNGRGYLYRPEPEGCVSLESCARISAAERDINEIYGALGLPRVNVVRLLNHYPIPDFLSSEQIDASMEWTDAERADALHTLFIGRQKDPYTGEPHREAVRLNRAVLVDGTYRVPRVPGEDYPVFALLTKLADRLGVKAGTLRTMQETFEGFIKGLPYPTDIQVPHIRNEMSVLADTIIAQS